MSYIISDSEQFPAASAENLPVNRSEMGGTRVLARSDEGAKKRSVGGIEKTEASEEGRRHKKEEITGREKREEVP